MSAVYSSDNFLGAILRQNLVQGFFDYFYIALITMAIIVSLTTPVERGIAYFKFLMFMFGFLLILTMTGIIYYLAKTSFYPPVSRYYKDADDVFRWH